MADNMNVVYIPSFGCGLSSAKYYGWRHCLHLGNWLIFFGKVEPRPLDLRYIAPATPLDDPRVVALAEAAQAVVDRWDSPHWKDLRHTGTHINELRDAISELEKNK